MNLTTNYDWVFGSEIQRELERERDATLRRSSLRRSLDLENINNSIEILKICIDALLFPLHFLDKDTGIKLSRK